MSGLFLTVMLVESGNVTTLHSDSNNSLNMPVSRPVNRKVLWTIIEPPRSLCIILRAYFQQLAVQGVHARARCRTCMYEACEKLLGGCRIGQCGKIVQLIV